MFEICILIMHNLKSRYKQLGERSRESIVNILLSFGAKGTSVVLSLMIVPLTIDYVNPTLYGIWLTLSSIIAWIGFFDFGLGNGMRNKLAESKADGNTTLAKQYVSTTYFTIGSIVLFLFVVIELINLFLDWDKILKVDEIYRVELQKVFAVLTAFFCLNMVVKLFTSLLNADQKPGLASWIGILGQGLTLFAIYILTKVSNGSLLNLALYTSSIPTIVLLIVSIYAFRFSKYKIYAPNFKSVRRVLIKDIMGIGVQFFVIYICLLVIFQMINIVISREIGPNAVTEYNIANKYFNIAHSVMTILIVPFWSAFTDAFHKRDFIWMKKVKRTLELIWCGELVVLIVMILLSNWFYKFWIGDSVSVSFKLSAAMALFFAVQSLGSVYMYMINGIGAIRLQLIIYVCFAIIALPLIQYCCRYYGLVGALIAPTIVFIIQSLVGKIQLEKILNEKSSGIWSK